MTSLCHQSMLQLDELREGHCERFQQVGTPAYYATLVRQWSKDNNGSKVNWETWLCEEGSSLVTSESPLMCSM